MQDLKDMVVEIPDFPKAGILFRDISPLLRQRFHQTITAVDALFSALEWESVDVVSGIESRGFIFAAALAERHRKGVVPIRKQGKLPPPVVDVDYKLEYGTGVLEMQRGGGRLLLVDDVLATGGTLAASVTLVREAGYELRGMGVLIDLGFVPGFSCDGHAARSVIKYA